ncbi:WXG100 family type VII secretion target [Sphaerisporangium fuscum]|uniref:WXG100 family type VII secretion target n=1 Tax=Sphaerisporangium fuscum TaxID=2835868 RepID=UPI001BDBCF94|nr:hypothetical protein [Sphaerisporangium fuscum]
MERISDIQPIRAGTSISAGDSGSYGGVESVRKKLEATDPEGIAAAGNAYISVASRLESTLALLESVAGTMAGDWKSPTSPNVQESLRLVHVTLGEIAYKARQVGAAHKDYAEKLKQAKADLPSSHGATWDDDMWGWAADGSGTWSSENDRARKHITDLNEKIKTVYKTLPTDVATALPAVKAPIPASPTDVKYDPTAFKGPGSGTGYNGPTYPGSGTNFPNGTGLDGTGGDGSGGLKTPPGTNLPGDGTGDNSGTGSGGPGTGGTGPGSGTGGTGTGGTGTGGLPGGGNGTGSGTGGIDPTTGLPVGTGNGAGSAGGVGTGDSRNTGIAGLDPSNGLNTPPSNLNNPNLNNPNLSNPNPNNPNLSNPNLNNPNLNNPSLTTPNLHNPYAMGVNNPNNLGNNGGGNGNNGTSTWLGSGSSAGGANQALAARGTNGAAGVGGMPYMPMNGGAGGEGNKDRERATWLSEDDESVWGGDQEVAPGVIC